MLKEIQMLVASGATSKNSTRLTELQFSVVDQEGELDARDFTPQVKSVIPTYPHWEFSCTGPEACLK